MNDRQFWWLLAEGTRQLEIREPLISPDSIWWIAATLFGAWLFALGASVGSFLNVVVYRVPAGLNLLSPGSRCPRCLHPIRAQHNIPILGWLLLRGRCADCGLPISTRYPKVELLIGVLALLVGGVELLGNAQNLPLPLNAQLRPALGINDTWALGVAAVLHFGLLTTLIGGSLIDFDGWRIPGRLLTPLLVATLAASVIWPKVHPVLAISPAFWSDIQRENAAISWNQLSIGWRAGLLDVLIGGGGGFLVASLVYSAVQVRGWLVDRYAVPITLAWIVIGMVFGWQLLPWLLIGWSLPLWLSANPQRDMTRQPLLPLRGLAVITLITLLGWRWIGNYLQIADDSFAAQLSTVIAIALGSWLLLRFAANCLPEEYVYPEPIVEPVSSAPVAEDTSPEPVDLSVDDSPNEMQRS